MLLGCPSEPPPQKPTSNILKDPTGASSSLDAGGHHEPLLDSGQVMVIQDAGVSLTTRDSGVVVSLDAGPEELICPRLIGVPCVSDADCDDARSCTTDTCIEGGVCEHHLLETCNYGTCDTPYALTLNPQHPQQKLKVNSDLLQLIALPGDFDGCISAPFSEQMYFKVKLENAGLVRFSTQNPAGYHQVQLKMTEACPASSGGPGGGPGLPASIPVIDADAGTPTSSPMVFYCGQWDPPPEGYRGGHCIDGAHVDAGTEEVPCRPGLECLTASSGDWCVGPDDNCEFNYIGQKRTAAVHLEAGYYYMAVVQFSQGGSWWSFDVDFVVMSVTALELVTISDGAMSFNEERQLYMGAQFADNTSGFLPPAIATWTTSDPQVAVLLDDTPGWVRGGVPGTATVTATYADDYGGASATYLVTVE